MEPPPTADGGTGAAGGAAQYFKFDSRLDYYMKLTEEPQLPDQDYGFDEDSARDPILYNQAFQNMDVALTATSSLPDVPGAFASVAPATGSEVPGQDLSPRIPLVSVIKTPVLAGKAGLGGQKCYFGLTNYLHLLPEPSLLWDPHVTNHGHPDVGSRKVLRGPENSKVEEHLVDCYFAWDNPLLESFTKSLYLRDKTRFESGHDPIFYSLALGHAIVAVGMLYSPESDYTAENDLPDDFASNARRLLMTELDSPSVGTVLALIVLCSLSAAEALDDQGWFYSGTALRLIPALGLDQEGRLSHPSECKDALQQLQHSIVKGAACLDTIWRSWCGRLSGLDPAYLPDAQAGDASNLGGQEVTCPAVSRFTLLELICRNLLWRLAQGEGNAGEIWTALEQWKARCPEPSEQTEQRVSALDLQSLMHYHGIMIQFDRLLPQTAGPSPGHRDASLARCVNSANEISRLQQLFRQRHGLRHLLPLSIQPMLAASLVHAQGYRESTPQSKESRQARQNVLRSIQVLGELAESMNAGSRALGIVMAAQQGRQRHMV